MSYDKVGDVQVAQGDLAGALKSYRDSLAICDRLAKSDPGNAGWQRDLSVSYDKVGDVQVAQGDLAGALKSYRDSLAICRPAGEIRSRQRRLAARSLGVVRQDRRRAGGAGRPCGGAEVLPATASRSQTGWRSPIPATPAGSAISRCRTNKVGDVLVAQGDLAGALKAYRDSLAIADRLAKSDPGNAGWQRDLSVSYDKVGDVQVGAGRPRGGAEVLPRQPRDRRPAGEIRSRQRRLAARSLGVVRTRSATCRSAQGDLAGALKSYRDSLAIRDRLAKSDPGNAGWQRDLSVSYNKVGDVQVAQGDLAGALKSYRDSLAIRDRLAKSDPGNAGWQRDLAISYAKLASVYLAQNDDARGREALEAGRAIMVKLVALSPDNATWKNDLAWFDGRIAALEP